MKKYQNSEDSRENLFESYGDSRENWFEIVAFVIILVGSPPSAEGYREPWEAGVETQKSQKNLVPLFKKDKNKKLISLGRRRLLQHYLYKVPVLHVVKYHLMGPWSR